MIFELTEELLFPPSHLAEEDGLLAVGGDLSVERLLLAYSNGIFPWYSDETPVLWYAPHERFVIFPEELKVSKSMQKFVRKTSLSISFDTAFLQVIEACASVKRAGQDGTWITADMKAAYTRLHELGFAHSVEVWEGESLVGGLYGVLVNKVFCGESMFAKETNASKMALIWLCENLDLNLVDCQVYTEHLESLGARMIPAEDYLKTLREQY